MYTSQYIDLAGWNDHYILNHHVAAQWIQTGTQVLERLAQFNDFLAQRHEIHISRLIRCL